VAYQGDHGTVPPCRIEPVREGRRQQVPRVVLHVDEAAFISEGHVDYAVVGGRHSRAERAVDRGADRG
jgi:hypothetical protein